MPTTATAKRRSSGNKPRISRTKPGGKGKLSSRSGRSRSKPKRVVKKSRSHHSRPKKRPVPRYFGGQPMQPMQPPSSMVPGPYSVPPPQPPQQTAGSGWWSSKWFT